VSVLVLAGKARRVAGDGERFQCETGGSSTGTVQRDWFVERQGIDRDGAKCAEDREDSGIVFHHVRYGVGCENGQSAGLTQQQNPERVVELRVRDHEAFDRDLPYTDATGRRRLVGCESSDLLTNVR
jgi:hypothetical protein